MCEVLFPKIVKDLKIAKQATIRPITPHILANVAIPLTPIKFEPELSLIL